MLISIIGFLIILGPLVIVHEFGHYIFARLFNVRADIFSVGFGPKLWSRQMGETELRVSAIPLGGFVKLLGEERDNQLSPEELKRSLHQQDPWKRFFIFFGGPLFNFLFAIFIFMIILVIGEKKIGNVIGRVVHQSVAAKAGLKSGDRILAINDREVHKFEEIIQNLNEFPKQIIRLKVLRSGETGLLNISVQSKVESGFSIYGEAKEVGEIDGLLPTGRSTHMGVSSPNSIAGRAGLKTGDQITKFNKLDVKSWEEIEKIFLARGELKKVEIEGKRKSGETFQVSLEAPLQSNLAQLEEFGLYSTELFIEKTIPDSPAQKADIKPGDRIITINERQMNSFFELKEAIQKSGEQNAKALIKWERDGQLIEKMIETNAKPVKDAALKQSFQHTIGVMPMLTSSEPSYVVERVWNPFILLYKATEKMVTFSWRNFVSVGKMVVGDVSVGTLGGPILIGKIAGESLTHGLNSFLTMMAILSIGLGVLNILPVPVLDGGHLLLLGIECIRGKPLSIKQMEVIQGIGLIFILALMGLVLKNDISRLAYF